MVAPLHLWPCPETTATVLQTYDTARPPPVIGRGGYFRVGLDSKPRFLSKGRASQIRQLHGINTIQLLFQRSWGTNEHIYSKQTFLKGPL